MAGYLNAGQFPERAPRPPRPKAVNAYLGYLQQRWAEREHNGRLLFEELRVRGYRASLTRIYEAIRPWRKGKSPVGPAAAIAKQWPYYTPRQTLWLLFKEEGERTDEEQRYAQAVLESSGPMARAFACLQRFRQMLTERDETALAPWTREAVASRIPELVKFVQGLYRDWEAVENALLLPAARGRQKGRCSGSSSSSAKAMGGPVRPCYKPAWWEQGTSTVIEQEPQTITLMVVEDKDRLTRFGFRYLDTLLRGQGRAVEVVNEAGNETEGLLADLTSIIYSFCARLYGQRRAKRKTESVIRTLEAGESEGEHAPG